MKSPCFVCGKPTSLFHDLYRPDGSMCLYLCKEHMHRINVGIFSELAMMKKGIA